MSNRNDGNGWKFDKPTDEDIIDALRRVLGAFCENHPECESVLVRCYREDDALWRDYRFSSPLPQWVERREAQRRRYEVWLAEQKT